MIHYRIKQKAYQHGIPSHPLGNHKKVKVTADMDKIYPRNSTNATGVTVSAVAPEQVNVAFDSICPRVRKKKSRKKENTSNADAEVDEGRTMT